MRAINTELEYSTICTRIEELLPLVSNETSETDKNYIELDLLSDLVADYEEKYEAISPPSFIEVLKLRMFEMELNQKKLSQMLGISTSRVSEYLNGKSEPTLKIAKDISVKLDIDPSIILGV